MAIDVNTPLFFDREILNQKVSDSNSHTNSIMTLSWGGQCLNSKKEYLSAIDSAKMALPIEMSLLAQSLSQMVRQGGKFLIFSNDSNSGLKGMDELWVESLRLLQNRFIKSNLGQNNNTDSFWRLTDETNYSWGL